MNRLSYTRQDLAKLDEAELAELQNSLADYLGTSQETEARRLNKAIRDEKDRRRPYGF